MLMRNRSPEASAAEKSSEPWASNSFQRLSGTSGRIIAWTHAVSGIGGNSSLRRWPPIRTYGE